MERSKKRVDALLMSFSAWMADRKGRPLRPRSREHYRTCVRKAIRLAEEGGYSVLAGDVRMLRYVLGKLSPHPSTQAAYLKALSCFYEFLKVQGLRKDNPVALMGRPRQIRSVPRPMPIEDCCAYLDAAHVLGPVHYVLACLGLYMGLRRDEMRRLAWACFFKAENRVWCDLEGKGGKKGRIPVHPNLQAALADLRAAHNSPVWVFPSPIRFGDPVSQSCIYKWHREIVESAGITRCTPHQLRHSFATYLKRTGEDIAIVQKALRHASIGSTMIYSAILDDELAEGIERLDFHNPRGYSNVPIAGDVAASLPPSWQERRQGS